MIKEIKLRLLIKEKDGKRIILNRDLEIIHYGHKNGKLFKKRFRQKFNEKEKNEE